MQCLFERNPDWNFMNVFLKHKWMSHQWFLVEVSNWHANYSLITTISISLLLHIRSVHVCNKRQTLRFAIAWHEYRNKYQKLWRAPWLATSCRRLRILAKVNTDTSLLKIRTPMNKNSEHSSKISEPSWFEWHQDQLSNHQGQYPVIFFWKTYVMSWFY